MFRLSPLTCVSQPTQQILRSPPCPLTSVGEPIKPNHLNLWIARSHLCFWGWLLKPFWYCENWKCFFSLCNIVQGSRSALWDLNKILWGLFHVLNTSVSGGRGCAYMCVCVNVFSEQIHSFGWEPSAKPESGELILLIEESVWDSQESAGTGTWSSLSRLFVQAEAVAAWSSLHIVHLDIKLNPHLSAASSYRNRLLWSLIKTVLYECLFCVSRIQMKENTPGSFINTQVCGLRYAKGPPLTF